MPQLYVFDPGNNSNNKVPLTKSSDVFINRDLLFAISGAFNALCQASGMRASYFSKFVGYISRRYAFIFILIIVAGSILCCCVFSLNVIIVIFGIGVVFLGNGLIYSTCVKNIDDRIESKYRLTCLSFWLLFSDMGALIGSSIWPSLLTVICDNLTQPYYCSNG